MRSTAWYGPAVAVAVGLAVERAQAAGRRRSCTLLPIGAGQPPQPVIVEGVAGRLLGQGRRLLRPHLSRTCKSLSNDVAEAVVRVAAAQTLVRRPRSSRP